MLEQLFPRNSSPPQVSDSSSVHINGSSASGDEQLPDDFWHIDEDAIFDNSAEFSYELSLDTFFNAQHFVVMQGHQGPVHSHSYRLRIRCRGESLSDDDNVLVGYRAVRTRVEQVVGAYNDRLLNDLPPFERLQPTTEILAAVLFQQIAWIMRKLPVHLISVTVWESPTESITYRREESISVDVTP